LLLKRVFFNLSEELLPSVFYIEKTTYHGKYILIKFSEINTREMMESYKNALLQIPEEEVYPLKENHYYIYDLIDVAVYTTDGELIGKVKGVLNAGNDLLEITSVNGKEILIPFVDEFVPVVDLEAKKIIIKVIEGLL